MVVHSEQVPSFDESVLFLRVSLLLTIIFACQFVFNLTTDLILFAQPIPSVWKLQMPLAKRVGIIAMLSLGLL